MKKIVFLLIASIILAGCSTGNAITQKDYFDKKLECSKQRPEIKNNPWYRLHELMSEDNKNHLGVEQPSIYYSPKLNTCLATYTIRRTEKDREFNNHVILDLLSGEDIYNKSFEKREMQDLAKVGKTSYDEFQKEIDELIK